MDGVAPARRPGTRRHQTQVGGKPQATSTTQRHADRTLTGNGRAAEPLPGLRPDRHIPSPAVCRLVSRLLFRRWKVDCEPGREDLRRRTGTGCRPANAIATHAAAAPINWCDPLRPAVRRLSGQVVAPAADSVAVTATGRCPWLCRPRKDRPFRSFSQNEHRFADKAARARPPGRRPPSAGSPPANSPRDPGSATC